MPRPKIAMVGGGSCNWSPRLLADIVLKEELQDADVRLLDTDLRAAELVAAAAAQQCAAWQIGGTGFLPTTDPAEALDGADFVIITITTGGLAAMRPDLEIPERYGILHTVGDTVGPGGWSRTLRNVPVFADLARQFRRHCPQAFLLNYTNPMSALTQTLSLLTPQPVVGLCHGLFENYRHLRRIFGISQEGRIRARYAGINHFFWMLDFSVEGRPGYPLLRRRLTGGRRLDDLIKEAYIDEAGHSSPRRLVATELYEEFGFLPYLGDRHTVEFFGRYLTGRKALSTYRIRRTSIAEREGKRKDACNLCRRMAAGKDLFPRKASRETAADIIAARWVGREFVDVMNLPNTGQVPNLPAGAVVETPGMVNMTGFAPIHMGPLPPQLQTLVLPHAVNIDMTVRAALDGNLPLALQALVNDPLCGHLPVPVVKQMGHELLQANRRHLPQFFGRKASA